MTAGRARRVLVVDDEALVAILLSDILHDLGFEVVGPVLEFDAALQLARDGDFDGAIIDLNLGGKASYPVARVLRARNIPFVFASGYSVTDAGLDLEAAAVIQKPYNMSELKAALQALDGA